MPAEPDRLAEALRPQPGAERPPVATVGTAELQAGLDRGEIVVRYQPVVRLCDRHPVMVEALARWQRPQAPVPPEVFVPLAEKVGLVRALSVVIASRAAAEMAPIHHRLGIGLSLNLPLDLLLQEDLVAWLGRALAGSGLRPGDVALELTETVVPQDLSRLHRALLRLHKAGYRVLLDDLQLDDGRLRLLALPFAGIKLDRSLVDQLPGSARARQAVLALVRRARARGQAVIAEGVSDARLWAVVRGLGVHHAQGFAVSRPLPAEALPAWWSGWRGRWQG